MQISPDSIIDFGKVKEGEMKDYSFRIINKGTNTLYIRNFASSCGCTKINNSKEDISPNDSTIITVKIDTKGKLGKSISIVKFQSNTENDWSRLKLNYDVYK
jgi:hypothetical protein